MGVLAGTLGSLAGLGGGFLAVPALRLFFGLPPAMAAGTGLLLVVANSAAASLFGPERAQFSRSTLTFCIAAIPGAILGALIVSRVPARWFDFAYAALLCVIAGDVIRRALHARQPLRPGRSNSVVLLAAGILTGFLSSMFGIGGGAFTIPALFYATTLAPHAIAATSMLVILVTSPAALAAHAFAHHVLFGYGIPLAAGGLLGGRLGTWARPRLSHKQLLVFVGALLLVTAAGLALRDML